jgi:hypothetical protein
MILDIDWADAWCRWWRVSEGRRSIKLFTTSETENVGISGELRFLVRASGEPELCDSSRVDNEEVLLERERLCGLGLRADPCVGTRVRGGEVPTIEENEECDE